VFKPFEVITPADLSFQQKITGLGGGCKVSRFFCICCESNSLVNYNLFHKTTERNEFCEFCIANDTASCCHHAINDSTKLMRKEEWLLDSLTLHDCLPEGESMLNK
jgi:hypothetical protein